MGVVVRLINASVVCVCVHVLLLGPITADMLVSGETWGGGWVGAGGGAAETRWRDYCRLFRRCDWRERTCVVLCSDMCFKKVMRETLKQMDFRVVFFKLLLLLFLESKCNYVE